MNVSRNISLKGFNTFGIESIAAFFSTFQSVPELPELLNYKERLRIPGMLILGGGSNILLKEDLYNGLVIKNEIKGIEILEDRDDVVLVKCGAGINWHQFVIFCLDNNFAGVENLSLIPGTVGASPMQNIGAYGVELCDVFLSLEAYHIKDRVIKEFKKDECEFGYRESVFKHRYKNDFIITSVTFSLRKIPVYKTSYGAIEKELELMGVSTLSIQSIAEAVIRIRKSKLPDPDVIGNAGSFFKNPIVSPEVYLSLKEKYNDIPGFQLADGFKLPAAWLIEQCGWKGFRRGDAGCHQNQALVLVNYGHAKGLDILNLSEDIIKSVVEKFHVNLEREVNIF